MGNLPHRILEVRFCYLSHSETRHVFIWVLHSVFPVHTSVSISFRRNEIGLVFSQRIVPASPTVAAPLYLHDTSHRSVTIIYNVDTGYRARTLNSPGKHHAWQRCANDVRSPDGIARECLVSGESHILGRQFS